MPASSPSRSLPWSEGAVAVLIGLAVPAAVSGRGVLQVLLGLALIGALAGLVRRPETKSLLKGLVRHPLALWAAACFGIWVLSVPGSLDPVESLSVWTRTLVLVLGATVLWAWMAARPEAWSLACKALILGTVVGVLTALAGLLGAPEVMIPLKGRFEDSEMLARTLKPYANVAMCLAPVVAVLGWRMGGAWRLAAVVTVLAVVPLIPLTNARAAMAGLGAASLVMALGGVLRHPRFVVPALIVTLLCVVLTLWIGLVVLRPWSASGDLNAPLGLPLALVDSHRQHIWLFVFERFLERPWLGWGMNVVNRTPGAGELVPGLGAEYVPSHPHNFILQALSETGLMGALPLFVAVGLCLWRSLAAFRRGGALPRLGQAALAAGFWTSMLFNFSLWASWWLLVFATLWAVLAAAPEDGDNRRGKPGLDSP